MLLSVYFCGFSLELRGLDICLYLQFVKEGYIKRILVIILLYFELIKGNFEIICQ